MNAGEENGIQRVNRASERARALGCPESAASEVSQPKAAFSKIRLLRARHCFKVAAISSCVSLLKGNHKMNPMSPL